MSFSSDIKDLVGATNEAIKLAETLSDWAERSCIIEIDNLTADTWELVHHGSSSGTFQEPVTTRLAPFDHVLITAVSSAIAQGAVGELRIRSFDVDLVLNYSNPFLGDNDLDVRPEGRRSGEFQLETVARDGNKNAQFRCAVGQPYQESWRFCPKCHALFNEGPGSVCPAGGPHDPVGWNYFLLHDVPAHPTLQAGWRFCPRCLALSDGNPGSVCPAGGPHVTDVGWNYCVPHDLPDGPRVQRGWRFCPKCRGVSDGNPGSVCPAGGPHVTDVGDVYNMAHKPG
ncbi:hypothetical protein [Kitasatospora sp. NPDC005748]|uniref:hypothetical protein n=1 Tax=Kitasatospora sp. NPDC005748 TaxID=3157063 RepID=UPI0033C643E0